jgi:hypothetical protein
MHSRKMQKCFWKKYKKEPLTLRMTHQESKSEIASKKLKRKYSQRRQSSQMVKKRDVADFSFN